MKRYLLPSLLFASAVSGCSMIHLKGPQLNTGSAAAPAAKEKEGESTTAAATPAGAGSTDAPAAKKDAAPADVVHKIPGFTADDAYSLAKIAAAFKLVTPDLVRYVSTAETYVNWAPTPYDTGIYFGSVPFRKLGEKDCNPLGFRVQAGYNRQLEEGLCSPTKSFNHLAAGTPVVVWAVRDEWTIVVTLDGGRYEVEHLEALQPQPTKDPAAAPLQHTFLGQAEIGRLAMIDDKVKPTSDANEAAKKEYVTCNLTILDKQEKEITAVLKASAALTSDQQDAKVKPIGERYLKQQEQTCDKHLAKLEKTIKAFIDERNTTRRKLWDDTAALRATLAAKP